MSRGIIWIWRKIFLQAIQIKFYTRIKLSRFLIKGYCYGKGDNIIPTLHIQDLCSWIECILKDLPEKKYIFLKDDGYYSLYEIA